VPDPIADILRAHGLKGPWEGLTATGLANRIYATSEVVIRIATDHPEAEEDARTESVAAPAARAAGILVPQLIAFDDSRSLVDRPYTIWERIHGETLGLIAPEPRQLPEAWRAIGRELARLHERVGACPDPNGWLDCPDRNLDLQQRVEALATASKIDRETAGTLAAWLEHLAPAVAAAQPRVFLHNDLHDMNVMCTSHGALLALIDWGDAGWGDAGIELAPMPIAAVPIVLDAYEEEAPGRLGDGSDARVLWYLIDEALCDLADRPDCLRRLVQVVANGDTRWTRALRRPRA
jgi:aminoglycoside phosphotransferase (APT) family kinase protein